MKEKDVNTWMDKLADDFIREVNYESIINGCFTWEILEYGQIIERKENVVWVYFKE